MVQLMMAKESEHFIEIQFTQKFKIYNMIRVVV